MCGLSREGLGYRKEEPHCFPRPAQLWTEAEK